MLDYNEVSDSSVPYIEYLVSDSDLSDFEVSTLPFDACEMSYYVHPSNPHENKFQ